MTVSANPTNIETVALVVSEPKADFTLTPIVLDEVRPDEVLVDMHYSGICHTDIVLQQGLLPLVEFPAVFGHEGAGIVRAVGSAVKDKSLSPGDAVLLSFTTCGDCKACKDGQLACCHRHPQVNHGAVRPDGSTPASLKASPSTTVRSQYFGQSSFSKTSVVQEKSVVKLCSAADFADSKFKPADLAAYAPMGCGFQTGAGTILNVLKPTTDDSLVLFGMGSVGLAALMAAAHLKSTQPGSKMQIIAVDIVPEKLALAKELGATHTVNGLDYPATEESKKNKTDPLAEAIRAITPNGAGATMAVDCTGRLTILETMVAAIGNQGTAAIVGVPPADAKIQLDPLTFLLENKRLIGVIEGDANPATFIPQLIKLHRAGAFPVDKLCKVYPVTKLQDAIHDMHSGHVIKPIIDWTVIE
ncbi:hypothetical protein SBRCBS47491_007868 [Sporothrix bragantina]|uniref:Enoyl reductase (ER) domain-containing protein n=1 Tax=Sporothrix bragantina TaxID=671064 RepID=A0ABP0CGP5_9PEZI